MSLNYYEILDVPTTATKEEIKAAFRKKAKMYHPDINKDFYAELKFKEMNVAASTLLDDALREQYDFMLGVNKKSTYSKKDYSSAANSARQAYKKASYEYKKAADEYRKSSFEKKFSDFFKQKERQEKKQAQKPINGDDITTKVQITKNEAIVGTTRKINILESEKCPKCFGAKFVNGTKCAFCDGVGEKNTYKKISVKIPANIKNGAKIRIKGQGSKGKFGGQDGNLYLIVEIDESSKFEIKEGIVYIEVPIAPFEAVLGADIYIYTPLGKTLLKIPENTYNNTVFKLYDCGILNPETKKRGLVVARVIININKPNDKEKALYEALRAQGCSVREEFYKKYGQ